MKTLDPSRVSARVTYDQSGRSFTMLNASELEVEIDTCSWAAIGGTTVNIYAADADRSVQLAFGVDAFLSIFEQALTRFSRLDAEFPAEDGSENQLNARNDFLRSASEKHPAVLAEALRSFRRLALEAEEAIARLTSMRIHN